MASWVLIPALEALFAELDRIAPDRDTASDGSIGDTAHQQETSDHNPDETGSVPIHDPDKINEVHAIDVDNNLNESDLTMEKVVQFLLGRCRSGAEKRLRYIIYNRRIWSASSGWVQKAYTGKSPHTEHVHFSASYDSNREADMSSWHLEDIPVALTASDKAWIESTVKANASTPAEVQSAASSALSANMAAIGKAAATGYAVPGADLPGSDWDRNIAQIDADVWAAVMKGQTYGGGALPAAGAFGQILAALAELSREVADLKAAAGQK
jgi:hypothetical protein